jgi:DNA-binding MarR family transcriptional regulator
MKFKEVLPDPDGEFAIAVPEYFFYMMFQAARRRDLAFDGAVEHLGLTASRARILAIVRRVEGCTMNELAKFTAVDRTTLTREVDNLVSRGLVSRGTPPNDRRKVCLTLTQKGEDIYAEGLPALTDFSRRSLQGVDVEQLREFARLLQTIIRNMVDEPEWAEDLIAFARSEKLRPID